MNITELTKIEDRNAYGDLKVGFESAIKTAYPKVQFKQIEPGPHGDDGTMRLMGNKESGYILYYPDGKYSSNKHFHDSCSSVIEVESGRKKHNFRPLFLLNGRSYNGDYRYRSLSQTFYIFGENEDGSMFLHRIRPKFGKSLDDARSWMWALKNGESVAKRQGDLAFIAKKRIPHGEESTEIQIGNHAISGDRIVATKNKVYAVNPQSTHSEHHAVELNGIYELRLAKVWGGGKGD